MDNELNKETDYLRVVIALAFLILAAGAVWFFWNPKQDQELNKPEPKTTYQTPYEYQTPDNSTGK